MKMKTHIVAGILALSLLAGGCGKFVRDELITMQNEIDLLYKQVDQMNKGLETLQGLVRAMAANGYIVSVEEFEAEGRGGYTLRFRTVTLDENGNISSDDTYSINLYSGVDGVDGVDAVPYVVSVKQDEEDGRWYWYSTQDEDWLKTEDGARFPVDGQTPQLKVEEGYWFLSWDGETWEKTEWKAKGEDAFEVFTKAEVFDDRVELTLAADGSVLVLPRFLPVDVALTVGGQPLDGDGLESGIAEDDLVAALGGGVSGIGGRDVGFQHLPDRRVDAHAQTGGLRAKGLDEVRFCPEGDGFCHGDSSI